MTTRARYRGFSTQQLYETPSKGLAQSNMDVVKQDLLNHIYTIPGERVMNPDFGTRIPLLAFEPLDEATLKVVEDDLRKVVDFDPRVQLLDVAVMALPDNNAIVALLDLKYLELNVTETFRLDIQVGT